MTMNSIRLVQSSGLATTTTTSPRLYREELEHWPVSKWERYHGARTIPRWQWEKDPTRENTVRVDGRNVFVEDKYNPSQLDQDECIIKVKLMERFVTRLAAFRALKAAVYNTNPQRNPHIHIDALVKALREVVGSLDVISDDRLRAVVSRWDFDGDESISYNEFSVALNSENRPNRSSLSPKSATNSRHKSMYDRLYNQPPLQYDTASGTLNSPLQEFASLRIHKSYQPPKQDEDEFTYIANILRQRGDHGVADFVRAFRSLDTDHNGFLSRQEFNVGMHLTGINFESGQIEEVFKRFDENGDGKISLHEFVHAFKGILPEGRVDVVNRAWDKVSRGAPSVTVEQLLTHFHPATHHKVIRHIYTEQQLINELLLGLGDKKRGDSVTEEEFKDYYTLLSVNVHEDGQFNATVTRSWRLDGGYRAPNAASLKSMSPHHHCGWMHSTSTGSPSSRKSQSPSH